MDSLAKKVGVVIASSRIMKVVLANPDDPCALREALVPIQKDIKDMRLHPSSLHSTVRELYQKGLAMED